MFFYILNLLFTVYTLMLLIRVVGSWFPSFAQSRFMQFVAYYTDPYLNLFRKIIPPLGVVDLSPLFAFICLQVAQQIIFFIVK
jgi:YggT family protein